MSRSTLVLAVVLVVAVVSTRWLRVNISPSVPYGLHVLRPVTLPLTRGTLVVVPVPESMRPWWSPWLPLLKPIAAVPGDAVCYRGNKLLVNGVDFGPVLAESHGQPLPHIAAGCQVIPEGMLFLASPRPRSLDSRYFGRVPMAGLSAQAVPLLTWR